MATGSVEQSAATTGNNYIKFPNGVLICWGTITNISIPANNFVDVTIAYPIAFTAYPALTLTPVRWTDPKYVQAIAKERFRSSGDVRIGNTTNTSISDGVLNWIAIGK